MQSRCVSKGPDRRPTPDSDQLVTDHLPLVKVIAVAVHRNLPVQVDLDDLVQAGAMGLVDAARKYDIRKKVQFETYAKYRIRGAILDSLRQLDWASRDLRKRQKQIEAVTRALMADLGRIPTEDEIAARLRLDVSQVRKFQADLSAVGCQHRTDATDAPPDKEPVEDPGRQPDRLCANSHLRELLASGMAALPQRSRSIIEMYYRRDMTMREIGELFGINESRVSQIHKRSLELMAAALRVMGVESSAVF